ncbi:MAG TPA: hypothetical protein VK136_10585 [Bacillota bacterium]|nr:hypothetical protein [Bacillota bacterium]
MGYAFVFLLGFGLAVSGGVTMIAYMNFLPAGLTWMDYVLFVKDRPECYFLPFGFLLMALAIWRFPNRRY